MTTTQPDLNSVLTEDDWVEWSYCRFITDNRIHSTSVFQDPRKTELLNKYKVTYKKISKSQFIIENFLSWPDTFQRLINDVLERVHISVIEAFAEVCIRAQKITELNAVLSIPLMQLDALLTHELDHRSKEFSKQSERFSMFQAEFSSLQDCTFMMLGYLYDEEHVLEVAKEWMLNTTSKSLKDFVMLVERWDEFKDFPVDWVVSAWGDKDDISETSLY